MGAGYGRHADPTACDIVWLGHIVSAVGIFVPGDRGTQKEIVCYGRCGGRCTANDPHAFVFGAGDDLCGMAATGSDGK